MAINAKVDNTTYEGIEKITAGGKTVELSEVYSGTKVITANGTHDVSGYAEAVVEVPTESTGGSEPTGSINITTNGTHDVADYAQAVVNVPRSGYDVDDFADGSGINYSNMLFYKAENVETSVSVIRPYAFAKMNMYKVTAPNATKFGVGAFRENTNLKEVEAPNLTSWGGGEIFYGCTSLTKAIFPKMNDGYLTWNSIFSGCTSLTEVNLDACTKLSTSMFENCKALQSISLPAATTAASSNQTSIFKGCTSLQNVNLPMWQRGASYMFQNCTSLEEISLPALTDVGNQMFAGCTALKKVDFGEGVTAVFNGNFKDCTALETVILRYNGMVTNQNKTFAGCANVVTVYVPAAQLETYRADSAWIADTKVTFAAIEGSEHE